MSQFGGGQASVRGLHDMVPEKVWMKPGGWTGRPWSCWRHNSVLAKLERRRRIKEAIVVVGVA